MSEQPPVQGRALKARPMCLAFLAAASLTANLFCGAAQASIHRHRWQHWQSAHTVRTYHAIRTGHTVLRLTDPEKDAALIVDAETGRTLYARSADELRHPASLTKMMTLYLLFEQLKSGQMTLATPLRVSEHAAVQSPTKLNVRPGTTIPVDTAIKAIVVLSANDVAVTVAENIGGTESNFAHMMTTKARQLGMMHTYYDNASGLPDPLQITTAEDLGALARHLAYDFPQYFHYFSTYSFSYRGITHYTHDNLIGRYDGADGIKTGYTNASGFNLVSSVVRDGMRIIGVVMGGTTARRRDTEMIRLLDDTFAAIGKNPQLVARDTVPWQALAENMQSNPVIAGFQFGTAAAPPPPATITSLPAPPKATTTASSGDDEDSAESRPDPALDSLGATADVSSLPPGGAPALSQATHLPNKSNVITAALPAPAAQNAAPKSAPQQMSPPKAPPPLIDAQFTGPIPEPKPSMSDAAAYDIAKVEKSAAPVQVAMADTNPSPAAKLAEDWTIQIGAFDNAALAKAELATYVERSGDVLGQVAQIISPFQSTQGHVLYRARFGPFAESRAREVCQVLTERGQTCFAAVAAR